MAGSQRLSNHSLLRQDIKHQLLPLPNPAASVTVLTLYPYLAMILAATPNPRDAFPVLLLIGSSLSCPDDGSDVSVREGGGAIAAPAPAVHKKYGKADRLLSMS